MQLRFTLNPSYDLQFAKNSSVRARMKERYTRLAPALRYTKTIYQQSWDLINDPYAKLVEQITEHLWKHKRYECVLSVEHKGISNWDGSNKIVRAWYEHPLTMRRITAHELVLHHHFYILKETYADADLNDVQRWALSEIAAFAITGLTKEAQQFWPWDRSRLYERDHNYPSIVELQKKLKQPFLKRKNYDDYTRAGIRAVKTYTTKIQFA